MTVNIVGHSCKLYKKCKICGEVKYIKFFSSRGGRKSNLSERRSYCYDCQARKHEVILSNGPTYSFDTAQLDAFSDITVRGPAMKNRRYQTVVNYIKAKRLVEEGAAGIIHSTLIHRFYNRKLLRKFVLERDNHTCHYCGLSGDTIDHMQPKSKGGLSTPVNCVCCCSECNQRKRDMDYEEYYLRKQSVNRASISHRKRKLNP